MEWISVETALPEIEEVVLVALYCKDWKHKQTLSTGGRAYGDEGWYWCHGEQFSPLDEIDYHDPIDVDVTHWMALPVLPNVE